jgi:hypothetical protein
MSTRAAMSFRQLRRARSQPLTGTPRIRGVPVKYEILRGLQLTRFQTRRLFQTLPAGAEKAAAPAVLRAC